MRAICEACAQPQPSGWKPGDLCVHCGKAVRRDVRCFWCAKWVPAAKFCRACGAESVDERHYGAARMLKDAGTDRFTVPKMLRELDPEQIDNFSRIYQRQAVVVARHVDDLRLLERFLHDQHWSGAAEEQLIPQLPWNDETLGRFTVPPLPAGDDLAQVTAIQAASPLPGTRELAALVRLRLDDWSAQREANAAAGSGDPTIRAEAALVLTGWRVQTGLDSPGCSREIIAELERSPFKSAAAARLAMLSRKPVELPPEVVASSDPEIAFTAALARGDVDRLCAALAGDELQRIAAGCALARLGVAAPLAPVLAAGPDEVRHPLVKALANDRRPAPELGAVLLDLVETTKDKQLRERAARTICRACSHGVAMRIARAAQGDRSIFQSLLQIAELPAEAMVEFGTFLVAGGFFTMSQYGLDKAAESGGMPDSFVPGVFAQADDKTKRELCRFAEKQLEKRGDEPLHRFLMNVLYGDHPAETRAAAWWSLHRWYKRDDYRGDGPLKLEKAAIERFFGSLRAFLPRLATVLRDYKTLKEVGVFDHLSNLLGYPDPSIAAHLIAEEAATRELIAALLAVIKVRDYYPNLRTGSANILRMIGAHPAWKDEVVGELTAFLAADGDLVYEMKRAIAAITGKSGDD